MIVYSRSWLEVGCFCLMLRRIWIYRQILIRTPKYEISPNYIRRKFRPMATDRRTDVMLLFALPLHLKQILNKWVGGGAVVDWIHLAEYMDQWLTCLNMCSWRGIIFMERSRYSDFPRTGGSGNRIPVKARFFAPVQTGPGAHPTSCTIGTGTFPGVKRPGRGVDHPPPSIADVKERVELYLYLPCGPSWQVIGWTVPFIF
jgi:hypothetical protein